MSCLHAWLVNFSIHMPLARVYKANFGCWSHCLRHILHRSPRIHPCWHHTYQKCFIKSACRLMVVWIRDPRPSSSKQCRWPTALPLIETNGINTDLFSQALHRAERHPLDLPHHPKAQSIKPPTDTSGPVQPWPLTPSETCGENQSQPAGAPPAREGTSRGRKALNMC